ncbi:MAG: hypothetical protein ACI9EW_004134 [Cellvibrionaceae bacterium]|jgi:hypothetical protein
MSKQQPTKLEQAVERKFRRDKIKLGLRDVRIEMKAKAAQVQTLEAELRKEALDVERLKSLTLQNLIQTIMGTKEDQLKKEQFEEIAARIKYETAVQLLDIMRSEEQELLNRLQPLNEMDDALETFLLEKTGETDEDEAGHIESKKQALQNFWDN